MSDDPEPYNSWGNGVAMRVSLCGWFASMLAEAHKFLDSVTRVTHDWPGQNLLGKALSRRIYGIITRIYSVILAGGL